MLTLEDRPGHRDCARCEGWGYVAIERDDWRHVRNCADCNPASELEDAIGECHRAIRKYGRRRFPVVKRVD